MKVLGRLTLLDIGLIIALIATGVFWAMSSRQSDPIANVDAAAWTMARDAVTAAFKAGDLSAAKAALTAAADIVEPAGDGSAAGIRAFAEALNGVSLTALNEAGNALNPLPTGIFFTDVYFAAWYPLIYPAFPTGAPAHGAEWAHINVLHADGEVDQYWGTVEWGLPPAVPESRGEADIEVGDIDFAGKLMLAVDGDSLQLSLVFIGPRADAESIDVIALWTGGEGSERTQLAGNIVSAGSGSIVVALPQASINEMFGLLEASIEIGMSINFLDGTLMTLRVEIGDTGHTVLSAAFAR